MDHGLEGHVSFGGQREGRVPFATALKKKKIPRAWLLPGRTNSNKSTYKLYTQMKGVLHLLHIQNVDLAV